ncbi:unnamed protein product [Vitrella brassicaformis CCMP3155]|uniref:Uncharacterized protein n=1 Tax=Vitrella brassicaformis (strain CCMP3155) TaxID=1169540 RepID=A0A0G4FZR0_VITBC|nr:unnamed protein product [Vitrella brassicaformis CCMP3155]|eukprot:CEM20881.1 unnamed protein product [Vitrella brassicaformis CCMP3155]
MSLVTRGVPVRWVPMASPVTISAEVGSKAFSSSMAFQDDVSALGKLRTSVAAVNAMWTVHATAFRLHASRYGVAEIVDERSGPSSNDMDTDDIVSEEPREATSVSSVTTKKKSKSPKGVSSFVVAEVAHQVRGKRKRTPKKLPEDEVDPTKGRLLNGGLHLPPARPRRTQRKKAAMQSKVQEERPPMLKSSQPLPTCPTPHTPDHLLPPTHQADTEIVVKDG